jgi:hypothetical protein
LDEEVRKALTFPETIGEFVVLTTAKKSTQAQRKVRAINIEHEAKGLFVVRLWTWDDIERLVDNYPSAQEFLGVQGPQAIRSLFRAELQPVHSLISRQGNQIHLAELDEVKKHLEDGQVQLATLLLGRLRKKSWDQTSSRHRSTWCTLLADAELRQGNEAKAAQSLIEAKTHQQRDDTTLANEIVAYEIFTKPVSERRERRSRRRSKSSGASRPPMSARSSRIATPPAERARPGSASTEPSRTSSEASSATKTPAWQSEFTAEFPSNRWVPRSAPGSATTVVHL